LHEYPIDIYGKNWERYIDQKKTNLRILTPHPDINKTFSSLCQNYSGIVNMDPNWGYGTNERVVTALHYGIPVCTNRNYSFMDEPGVFQYSLISDSIKVAMNRMSENETKVNIKKNREYTPYKFWDDIISPYLYKLV
jgi:hypothetical protein